MDKNDISVIIPVYNREQTIGYCLESVFRQTLQPLEILVVDDCSTDKTVERVKQINHPLVRIIRLDKNSGAQAARNRGILEAKGEWIAFQDSDDEWMPDKLEKQISFAITNNYSVIYTGVELCINGETKKHQVLDYSVDSYYKILNSPGPMFQGLLAKKSCFEKIGFLDEKIPSYQEWDTFIRLAKYYTLGFLNEPLFKYHLHDNDRISKETVKQLKGYSIVVDKHKDEMIAICGKENYIKHLIWISDICNDIREKELIIKTCYKLIDTSSDVIAKKSLKKLVLRLFPFYYHRFSNQIDLIFIFKRWIYQLRKFVRLT